MASQVDLMNRALVHIGLSASISLPTEASREARVLSRLWDGTRDQALEMADWRFARTFKSLPELVVSPLPPTWSHVYEYPADCVAPRVLARADRDPDTAGIPFEKIYLAPHGTVLVSDEANPCLWYTARLENPSLWSPGFQVSFALLLAALGSPSLMDAPKRPTELYQMYQLSLANAEVADANAAFEDPWAPEDSSWVSSRD